MLASEGKVCVKQKFATQSYLRKKKKKIKNKKEKKRKGRVK